MGTSRSVSIGRGVRLTRARKRGRDGRFAALRAGGDGDGEARGNLARGACARCRVAGLGDGVGLVRDAGGAKGLVHRCVDVDGGLRALGDARGLRAGQSHRDGRQGGGQDTALWVLGSGAASSDFVVHGRRGSQDGQEGNLCGLHCEKNEDKNMYKKYVIEKKSKE